MTRPFRRWIACAEHEAYRADDYSHWLLGGLVLGLTVLAIGCSGGGSGGGTGDGGFVGMFTSDNLELDITIDTVIIPADLRPEVTFAATDDAGALIPISEMTDVRFILAVLERMSIGSPFEYQSYSTGLEDPDDTPDSGDEAVQAAYDPAELDGISVNSDGSFTYKFDTALPPDYDPTATHQLGGQFRRLSASDDVTYRANLAMPFRPDGAVVTETREITATQSCNDCHTRLSEHGDIRREVQLCILCHNSGSVDAETGNSLHFAELIHKIHQGAELPSFTIDAEPYQISGFRDTIHDYSDVEFPQDIRDCTVCHKDAAQADAFEFAPTFNGCVSCHDRTWFGPIDETPPSFTNHVAGELEDNSLCSLCHAPDGTGASLVRDAHTIPTESEDAPGLFLAILDVATFPGVSDTGLEITFAAEDGAGDAVTELADLDIVASTVAYPVPEYEVSTRETIASGFGGPDGTLVNNGDGSYRYTFAAELPTGSTDTFAVAMEGRREFIFREEVFDQGTSTNGRVLFTLDGSDPVERRMIVDEAKCNTCHKEIREHGTLRTGVQFCVMCHNPNATDEAQRPFESLPPESINFKDLIHRIHTGEEGSREFTVYGFGNEPHDYSELRFPGDRRACTICHVEETTSIPLPEEALSTFITQDDGATLISELLPTRAACVSCHDTDEADSHALINTDLVNNVETCVICHSDSDDLSVPNVHAIDP